MPLDRRSFLVRTGLLLSAEALARQAEAAGRARQEGERPRPPLKTWGAVRREFDLTPEYAHLAGLLLASHPRQVRAAVERHRRALDANPVHYLYEKRWEFEERVLGTAARYLGADPREIALTDSTTMGLATLYTGLRLAPGQDAVCTTHDHYSTRESLRLRARRTGAPVREVALYASLPSVTPDEIVASVVSAVGPKTRAVAITWVHSSTGLKLPVRRIADALAETNARRDPADRVLLCVDGVHGFGVENVSVADLGCDFFVAGCHKWLHGPRGTGLVWGREEAWDAAVPTIPSFTGTAEPGAAMTPGGFHSFEHRWALADAFEFHERIGKARVEARVRDLARHAKEGLASMAHVRLHTPMSEQLSSGLVCFEVDGADSEAVVEHLRERRVVASVAPYAGRYVRLAASVFNTHAEIDRALRAVRELAGPPADGARAPGPGARAPREPRRPARQ